MINIKMGFALDAREVEIAAGYSRWVRLANMAMAIQVHSDLYRVSKQEIFWGVLRHKVNLHQHQKR